MSPTRITVICENRSSEMKNIAGEHGFSVLIEKNGTTLLMDTGQGMTLKSNARTLGIDFSAIDTLVVSHGHFDHTGGLTDVFPVRPGIRLIAHPDIFAPKYAEHKTPQHPVYAYIGIPFTQAHIESHFQSAFEFKREFEQISDGIYFSGEIDKVTDFELPDTRLKIKTDGGYEPDPLKDDISLLVETDRGPVIVTGCAHSGIVNVIKHFEKKTGYREFYGVIGGTHLGFLHSDRQLEQSLAAFEQYRLKLVAVSHCTGNEAAAACYDRFRDRFAFANAGWRIEL